jgi:hypothetical protein
MAKLFEVPAEKKELLVAEGKWPAKDMQEFSRNGFITAEGDSELFTRREMQVWCPDILVTNYSMLEYMLLRPIENSLFAQTRDWLGADASNCLTVVVDEAHMYRGAAGAEVALLLRRLQSRLEVDRSRIRYILTSASLGESEESKKVVLEFAADLTGLTGNGRPFELIKGVVEKVESAGNVQKSHSAVLAGMNPDALNEYAVDLAAAVKEVGVLFSRFGVDMPKCESADNLRDALYQFLSQFPPATRLMQFVTGNAKPRETLCSDVFGESDPTREKAFDVLLALCCMAKRSSDGRTFLPIRLHLMFRGLGGLHACINPACESRHPDNASPILGRLFDIPRIRCECGSRVYELMTHRECGASFIRGYTRNENADFLWHEADKATAVQGGGLVEVHYLVEVHRNRIAESHQIWLHKTTGRILRRPPPEKSAKDYVQLVEAASRPDNPALITFHRQCPVCLRRWQREPRIMDLTTRGEAPFAHLVKTQLLLQPPTKPEDAVFPNGGRKSLLFSDGRQKAARLARDIPREVERDVFRQILILAIDELRRIGQANRARPDTSLFTAFIHVLAKYNLKLFDGAAGERLAQQVRRYRERYVDDLQEALIDGAFNQDLHAEYRAHLLRQLCHSFYSVQALTLAAVEPTKRVLEQLALRLGGIAKDDLLPLTGVWIQNLLAQYALDDVASGVRIAAAGFIRDAWGESGQFSARQRVVLQQRIDSVDQLERELVNSLTLSRQSPCFLDPSQLVVRLCSNEPWWQCHDCSYVTFYALLGHCPNCGGNAIRAVPPDESRYLRARKTFWRDPVAQILSGERRPFSIDVEEHTAQLSHRDYDEPTSTTEEFERRFRDILVHPLDTPIDVLSSTTTMEVGIDIGSLVGVGMRNVPPMRQNYQQRAGRAGRRGSSVSSVITYAQNNPHDNHYFVNPKAMIAGDPPLPSIDVVNPRIVERHVHAALIQRFFQDHVGALRSSSDVFSVLGSTWDFYYGEGDFTLVAFKRWTSESEAAKDAFERINAWIPKGVDLPPAQVAARLIARLEERRPLSEDELDGNSAKLIEFLFVNGLLPSYAFPRDLCAFQIESLERVDGRDRVKILERPMQGLNIALAEYAPGRLLVVNKETYRIGTVTSGTTSSVVDRGTPLFRDQKRFLECPDCSFTSPLTPDELPPASCPLCEGIRIRALSVLQPEVVYADGRRPINELEDEQVYSIVTSAQMPTMQQPVDLQWMDGGLNAQVSTASNQLLLMLNKGEESISGGSGFLVCDKCGKAGLPGRQLPGRHQRDYLVEPRRGQPRPPALCDGTFHNVVLGYSFTSDTLLFRLRLAPPFLSDIREPGMRAPLDDALTSASQVLALAAAHVLDIDVRELNAGHRFLRLGDRLLAEMFLYDTLSGGAGYANMAAARWSQVVNEALGDLLDCDCQASCDKCLRHYGNRFIHANLDRFLAIDVLRYAIRHETPALLSRAEQSVLLRPLVEMLQLEGWEIAGSANVPVVASLDGRRVQIGAIPSLLDAATTEHGMPADANIFTPYQLIRDLPGCFARVRHP